MRIFKDTINMTPREYALSIILTEIAPLAKDLDGYGYNAGGTSNPYAVKLPDGQDRAVRRAIAKIHNQLLEKSGLDGMLVEAPD